MSERKNYLAVSGEIAKELGLTETRQKLHDGRYLINTTDLSTFGEVNECNCCKARELGCELITEQEAFQLLKTKKGGEK